MGARARTTKRAGRRALIAQRDSARRVAAVAGALATRNTTHTSDLPEGIDYLMPARDQVVSAQGDIGVQLLAGYKGELTLDGLPRIIRVSTLFLVPMVEPYLPRSEANRLVELLARLVISYFLAPSDHVDLGDAESAHTFVSTFILPAFHAALTRS